MVGGCQLGIAMGDLAGLDNGVGRWCVGGDRWGTIPGIRRPSHAILNQA
ncbi:hypothetical protein Acr_10g0006370 [Actinidia rufa]|uniref:Uncharacterized protein n=1 Tax=Actinidia rufa TaxID=165716 RepID=A0A7J0F969_9ERIC|nr:hypothetical protein Acr_10g0006370 [Actinidia rufa]